MGDLASFSDGAGKFNGKESAPQVKTLTGP